MRLPIQKTLKLYIGGKFARSESGQTVAAKARAGGMVNVCNASRKDLRDTLEILRKAQPGWAGRTAYNRGQILYRLGEMLEDRVDTLPTSKEDAHAAIDRAVHHAGWTDKVGAVLSTLNPVASSFVNYSAVRPLGIVVAAPRPQDGLLGMVEAICAPLVMGDTVALLVPPAQAELATALSEALAVSDVPGGVVNILTGDVEALVAVANICDDLDSLLLWEGAISADALATARHEGALVMRRIVVWKDARSPATPIDLQRLAEVQTVWMSQGVGGGSQAAY